MLNFTGAYPNVYSAMLLLILIVIIYIRRDFYTLQQRVFFSLLLATISILILEGLTFVVDGTMGRENRNLNYTINFILFFVFPFAVTLWANYLHLKLYGPGKKLSERFYYVPPIIIVLFLLFMNQSQPVLFSIDANNFYQRELGIYIIMAFLLILSTHFYILTIRRRVFLKQREMFGLFALILLPLTGGVLQMFLYGISTFFSMFALGLVTAYIALENVAVNTDELTELFTRRTVFAYIDSKVRREIPFTLILFDIDNLKEINDEFGHRIGDGSLIAFTETIQNECDCRGMLSRVSGNEFLIVSDMLVTQEIEENLRLVKDAIGNIDIATIHYSHGYVCSLEYPDMNVDDLLQITNERMQEQKAINRNLMRQHNIVRRRS